MNLGVINNIMEVAREVQQGQGSQLANLVLVVS